MAKVTSKTFGTHEEPIFATYQGEVIYGYPRCNTVGSLSDITKIEKQVKELTKDELYKYVMITYGTYKSIEIYADCVVITLGEESNYIELHNDTYVDVTEVYKENGK